VDLTKPQHVKDAIKAAERELMGEDVELLEQPCLPRKPEGF
jgi:hypothetical protein